MVLAIGIEHALDVADRCSHDADAREHRRTSERRNQHQRFHCRLPLWRFVLGFGKLGDVVAGVLKRDELGGRGATVSDRRTAVSSRDQPSLQWNSARVP
jgi:hypothetical protein